jgi:hypothetical protein
MATPGARPGACEVVLPAGDAEGNVVVQMQRAVSAKHVKSWGAIFHANVLKTLAAALRRPECAALSLFFPPNSWGWRPPKSETKTNRAAHFVRHWPLNPRVLAATSRSQHSQAGRKEMPVVGIRYVPFISFEHNTFCGALSYGFKRSVAWFRPNTNLLRL